jgi:hypothetical protein
MRTTIPLLAALLAFPPSAATAADPDLKGRDFFELKIRPVLVEHCYGCHSLDAEKARKLKAGLRLDTADAMRAGGDSGAAVVPGKPGDSLLVKALKGIDLSQMPPKGRLPDAVIADFEKWVQIGAPDPRTEVKAAPNPTTIDIERGRQHWAFQPPRKIDPPDVRDASWPRTELDRFVLAKLEERGLNPNRPADRRTLIRRVTFDLIGLPPTPEEVEAFVNDSSPDAYAKLIDKLLASPHHGERWARHWLDVARYSEDQAHTFAVKPKTSAWRYRDWVIRAFNDDMPYDKFVRLQLAGDLMPEDEGDPFTRLAGLGLLGLGAEYYKGSPTAREDELDDKVDTVTRGFLGLTVSCARCHDHKYDPIPQRDYYSIAGIFNGCQMTEAPLAPADEVKRYDTAQARIQEQDEKIKAWLTEKATDGAIKEAARYVVAAWKVNAVRTSGGKVSTGDIATAEKLDRKYLDRWAKYLDPANAGRVAAALKGVTAVKPPKEAKEYGDLEVPAALTKLADEFQAKLLSMIAESKPSKERDQLLNAIFRDKTGPFFTEPAEAEKGLAKADAEKLASMRKELERLKQASPPMYPVAHVVKGGGQEMKVYIRGNPSKPGEPAPKGFLQVFAPATAKQSKDFTRLDLANAIASPDNPLTARVIVNRVWAQHFGRGLVATPSNFGTLGDRPSHPELLDWLTVRFVENGWSLKWLHREIVLSATYRLGSDANPVNDEVDADNVYLWRANRRRLEVEPWRDALLAVSGRLDPALGGQTTDLKDPANVRRTVYAKISRHELDGLLRLFDFPDANVTADKRTLTTVPQQQLFVLNSEFMIRQAKAFAGRVQKGAETDAERIALAYRLAYARPPTDAEVQLGLGFLGEPAASDDKLTRWEQYAQALLAANEFLYID